MARYVDKGAQAFRGTEQGELLARLRDDRDRMLGIATDLTDDEWAGLMVPHKYMGPLPAAFYPLFQLVDYGVHSWDIRQGTGSSHGLDGDSADLLVPLAFILWQSTPDVPAGTETYMVGVEVTGRNAGQHRVTVGPDGVAVEESDLDDLPAVIELDAASLVLTAYGRMNAGTIRGDRVVWHPVLLAEQIGTLASIAAGRFVLQCGLGDGSDQFAAMGAAIVTRVSRFEATLDIVRRLLNAEEVTHTEHFGVRGARISPVPPEPVEIWLAGHARAALDRASRMADGWIAGPDVSLSAAASLADAYRRSCADRDRAPGAVAIRRDVYVGHNQADAERVLNGAIAAGYRGFDPSVLVLWDGRRRRGTAGRTWRCRVRRGSRSSLRRQSR